MHGPPPAPGAPAGARGLRKFYASARRRCWWAGVERACMHPVRTHVEKCHAKKCCTDKCSVCIACCLILGPTWQIKCVHARASARLRSWILRKGIPLMNLQTIS